MTVGLKNSKFSIFSTVFSSFENVGRAKDDVMKKRRNRANIIVSFVGEERLQLNREVLNEFGVAESRKLSKNVI